MSSISHVPHTAAEVAEGDVRRQHQASHAPVAPNEIAVGVVIGRASEYFDFFTYGIASVLVFPTVFFPFLNQVDGILLAFTIFSFAFVARPFGTTLFMAIQRNFGRSTKLTASLFLLGTSTVCIAFLPANHNNGYTVIFILGLLRFLQGIALGGSWDGLPSLLALNAPKNRRGWFAMLGQLGAPIGFLIAGSIFLFLNSQLSHADFMDWGWRYPFFVAFAINVVALFARLRLVVTEEYTQALEESVLEPIGTIDLVHAQGYNLFIGAFAALASYALFHLVTVFPLSWIAITRSQDINNVLIVQLIGALVAILATVASGVIADKVGRRNTLGTMAVLIGVFAVATPFLLNGGRLAQDAFLVIGFALLGLSYGQAAGTVTANFEKRFRYTGAALTTDFAWLIGAAFAPLVALGLSQRFGLVAVSAYLLSGVVCTLLALRINKSLEAPRPKATV
ncbi:MFS transporter [Luteibacter aegosomaticola]|uniref:MFS transporter n=1 Tax=Luteibacter aegosomaticola TaxID=2911538 RepID=UPI001FFAE55F|nr:MFS transporter [Luteibacter aegosomaticola]UPG90362.1 MFS transporter [Luteibacter aegosomaticola]